MTKTEIFSVYVLPVLASALTAMAGFFGAQLRAMCRRYLDDRIKRDVARTCVRAVEQLYRDLGGDEKLKKAQEGIREMLAEKQISISQLELNLLIESMVGEFRHGLAPEGALPFAEADAETAYSEEGGAA